LIEIGKKKKKPDVGFMLEAEPTINLPFERKLTFDQTEEITYKNKPKRADTDFLQAENLVRLFGKKRVDREAIRSRIKHVLADKTQASLAEVIELSGGIDDGLPQLFGYLSVSKDFKHTINKDKMERIVFDRKSLKSIHIPEVILTK
jgi:hypothetical protein